MANLKTRINSFLSTSIPQYKLPSSRPTWAEIDLNAIAYNLNQVRKVIGPGVKILAAVKANAYGHGMVMVAKELESLGVDLLGVACVDEALQLKKAGVRCPILIFSHILPDEARSVVAHGIISTVSNMEVARALNNVATKRHRARVHLKIDTGMGRIGVWHEEALTFIKTIVMLKNIKVEGIYTHFPSADERDKKFTMKQLSVFNNLLQSLERKGIDIPYRHAANSMGIMGYKDSHFNMVRPGLMLYGMHSSDWGGRIINLKPALSLKSRITFLKVVPPGRSISYGRTWTTKSETLIATIPIGYGDGYTRLLSNKAQVLLRGKRANIVGRVCMDQTMLDVGHVKGVKLGDEVTLIGRQGKDRISAEELASLCGTIPYEITCWISHRVRRVYKKVKKSCLFNRHMLL